MFSFSEYLHGRGFILSWANLMEITFQLQTHGLCARQDPVHPDDSVKYKSNGDILPEAGKLYFFCHRTWSPWLAQQHHNMRPFAD